MARGHSSDRRAVGRGTSRTNPRRWCDAAVKCRYPDKRAADRAKHSIAKRYPDRDQLPVRSYPCETCHGWHLTSWETPDGNRQEL